MEPSFRGRLVTTQFYRPLALAAESKGNWQMAFIDLVPWPFYFKKRRTVSEFIREHEERQRLKKHFGRRGCPLDLVKLAYPWHPRQFMMKKWQAWVFSASALPVLLARLFCHRPHLVIARNYPAGLLALLLRLLVNIPYVFDPRGLYPEHGVNAGDFSPDSSDYQFWKRRERQIIQKASACVAVSLPFAEEIKRIEPRARVYIIPCNVDTDEVYFDPGLRSKAKTRYGLEGRFVLLHLGSFGAPGDRGLAAKYLKRFRRTKPEAVLVAATGTPAFVPEIRKAFLSEGLSEDDFRVINPDPEDLPWVRALGDVGLILERRAANTHVCLSVKLGEYLAAGMPVICTPFVAGAAGLVRQYGCGLIIDPDDEGQPLDREKKFLAEYTALRGNGFRLVSEYLSLNRCARGWQKMIEEVLPT